VDVLLLGELELSYMRRKGWESRILALEIVKALGESLGGGRGMPGRGMRGVQRVSADALLAQMGARIT